MTQLNIFEARLRHEDLARRIGLSDEEREITWDLMLDVRDIQYPPGPTPQQEKKMMALGKIVSDRLKLQK